MTESQRTLACATFHAYAQAAAWPAASQNFAALPEPIQLAWLKAAESEKRISQL